MTPNPYSQEKQDQLRALADNIGQSHYSKRVVEKNREQAARQLEEQLRTDLNEIIINIVRDDTNDISQLQRTYSIDVEHTIRSAVGNAYAVGVNYVGEVKKMSNKMFITETDVKNI